METTSGCSGEAHILMLGFDKVAWPAGPLVAGGSRACTFLIYWGQSAFKFHATFFRHTQ